MEEWKKIDSDDKRLRKATELYNKYLSDSAPQMVNIERADVKKQLKERFFDQDVSKDLFDEASEILLQQIQRYMPQFHQH